MPAARAAASKVRPGGTDTGAALMVREMRGGAEATVVVLVLLCLAPALGCVPREAAAVAAGRRPLVPRRRRRAAGLSGRDVAGSGEQGVAAAPQHSARAQAASVTARRRIARVTACVRAS